MGQQQSVRLYDKHLVLILTAVIGLLELNEVDAASSLRDLQTVATLVHEIEVTTAALLVERHVSWAAMAKEVGVTHQSLNYRLSKAIVDLSGDAPSWAQPMQSEATSDPGRLLEAITTLVAEIAGRQRDPLMDNNVGGCAARPESEGYLPEDAKQLTL